MSIVCCKTVKGFSFAVYVDCALMFDLVAGLAGVATATVGGTIGYFAALSLERFRRRGVVTDARRKAYATWFASESLMSTRLKVVCDRMVGFPRNMERHRALTVEMSSLADEFKTLVIATNEALLLERGRRIRERLTVSHDCFVMILGELDFAAHHYGENIEFHEMFDQMTEEELATRSVESRENWRVMRDAFEQHDAECPYKSRDFRNRLVSLLDEAHSNAGKLREQLANTLAR